MNHESVNGESDREERGWSTSSADVARIEQAAAAFKASYEENGFAVVKQVFSLDEVLEMRRRCAAVFEQTAGKIGDVATYPPLREVLLDDRVIAIVRAALGDPVVYFGDSTFYANSRFDRHIHNDARGDLADPSRSPYPLLRIGIYLQDHAFHSNGLKVRPGSHRRVFWNARTALRLVGLGGERLSFGAFQPTWYYNVPTEPGDLVFWNLRTHHAGHAVRLRFLDGLALPPSVEAYVPNRLARPMPKDRYAIFASWGSPSSELDAYIKQIGYNAEYGAAWRRSSFDSKESRAAFARKHVTVRDDVLRLCQLA